MGHYSYSPLRQKFTPEQVEAEVKTIVSECLPNVVAQVQAVGLAHVASPDLHGLHGRLLNTRTAWPGLFPYLYSQKTSNPAPRKHASTMLKTAVFGLS